MIGVGIGLPFYRVFGGIDAQAQAHFNRVIADGGLVPSGLSGVNAFFNTIKTIYGTADITTAISVGLDPQVLGYKLGAGAGTTLGQAAQKLYSCSGASGDVVQATAASQPLLLTFDGVNKYFQNINIADNSCSCPITLTQTDTLEFVAKLDLTNSVGYAIGTVDNAAGSRAFYALYDGASFGLLYGSGLSQSVTASVTTNRYNGWFRVTLEKSGSNSLIKFYKSDEFNITDKNLVTWVQIGSTITGTYAAMPTTLSDFNILSGGQASNTTFAKVYYAQVSESIGGSPLAVFNPNQYNAATSQTQWTSSTGEVWTINTGTATTGYKGVLVDRSIVQGDGVDDGLTTSATINMPTVFTIYGAFIGYNNEGGSGKSLFGKSNIDGAIYRHTSTTLGLWLGAGGAANPTASATATNLNLVTAKRKIADNTVQANNGVITNNNNNVAITNSTVTLFLVDIYGSSNGLITTGILSLIEDDTTQKTAMYNYIKSINNNAF